MAAVADHLSFDHFAYSDLFADPASFPAHPYSDLDFEILRFTVENSVEIGEILRSSGAKLKNKFQYPRGLSPRGIE